MAHLGSGVEYGLHCLLFLVDNDDRAPSSRDLAEFQGISPTYVAKLFTQLEKAGLVASSEGVRGGYRLARSADEISVLDVVDAIEGGKPLFQCREIRGNCVLFDGQPPPWSGRGVCGIHAVMLAAEREMRRELARHTLAAIASGVAAVVPAAFAAEGRAWFAERADGRLRQRQAGKDST